MMQLFHVRMMMIMMMMMMMMMMSDCFRVLAVVSTHFAYFNQ